VRRRQRQAVPRGQRPGLAAWGLGPLGQCEQPDGEVWLSLQPQRWYEQRGQSGRIGAPLTSFQPRDVRVAVPDSGREFALP
jgi:hypothetical protein